MGLENWLAFVVACAVISVIPGPSVLMVIGYALSKGRKAAFLSIAGNLAGGIVVMSASYLGLGLVLASSALAFAIVKWAGVAYLAYLGLSQIIAARRGEPLEAIERAAPKKGLLDGFLTGMLNPKAIIFYMAFLSQFIDPTAPKLTQFLILVVSSTVVVAGVLAAYALLATKAGELLTGARARRRLGYASGSLLLGGSALMAASTAR